MPRYEVELSVTLHVVVVVEAASEEDAEVVWANDKKYLEEARASIASDAHDLDDYEFDVECVTALEGE
jgi:uncharacterized Zn finger protein